MSRLDEIRYRQQIRQTLMKHGLHPIFNIDSTGVTQGFSAIATNEDGGSGSGNWGHAGVKGQRGGSAPGGGKANRYTTAEGGYTSSAKKKKELATTHAISKSELTGDLPDGTKTIYEANGYTYVATYNAASKTFNVTTVGLPYKYEISQDEYANLAADNMLMGKVLVPKEATLSLKNETSAVEGKSATNSEKPDMIVTPLDIQSGDLTGLNDGATVEYGDEYYSTTITYHKSKDLFIDDNSGEYWSPADLEYALEGTKVTVSNPVSHSREISDDVKKVMQNCTVYASREEANNALFDKAGETWNTLSGDEKEAICTYTGSAYYGINESLRFPESIASSSKNTETINNMTSAISKSKADENVTLFRGVDKKAVRNMFNISEGEMSDLVGRTGKDEGFMSCGSAKGTGFTDDLGVQLTVVVPKGTECMYVEPVSKHGGNLGTNWDGKTKANYIGSECETIIQRGTEFTCTRATKNANGSYEITIVVTGQNYQPLS